MDAQVAVCCNNHGSSVSHASYSPGGLSAINRKRPDSTNAAGYCDAFSTTV